MDQETKDTISKIQQAIWKLRDARALLDAVDGMADYTSHIDQAIADLDQELDEIWSLERA
jgi:hypothetical protein